MENSFISFEQRLSILDIVIIVIIYTLMVKLIPEGGTNVYIQSNATNWYKSAEVLLLVATFIGMNINIKIVRQWLGFGLGMVGLCKV
jgi:hypothetical protein